MLLVSWLNSDGFCCFSLMRASAPDSLDNQWHKRSKWSWLASHMRITEDIAELWGLHAGDGTLYRTNSGVVWELRGNIEEKEFYDEYVLALLRRIFDYCWVCRKRSGGANGCYGVRCCCQEFHQILLQGGFPIGRKTTEVCVPNQVLSGPKSVQAAFLRGLFASDGHTSLMKINGSNVSTYPIIGFGSRSKVLAQQTALMLDQMGVKSYSWSLRDRRDDGTDFRLRITGRMWVKRFIECIGLPNHRQLRRIQRKL